MSEQMVTVRQLKFIQGLAREAGLDEETVRETVHNCYTCTIENLTRRDASNFIEYLQSLRNREIAS